MPTFTAQNRIQGVRGTSIINNRIRVKLGLTMEQYAILDAIQSIKSNRKPVRFDDIFVRTGIQHSDIIATLQLLRERGFIRTEKKVIYLQPLWDNEFNVAVSFEVFWNIFKMRGNKQEALKNYRKAIQIIDVDKLHEKAELYVKSVLSAPKGEWKHIKHAQGWLNPTARHWEDVIEAPENSNIYKEDDDER